MTFDPGVPLPDISADEPAGPNLEFDPDFAELERQAQGKPEQQYGTTVVPAEDPEWKDVVASAWTLLDRTYDLRVFGQLAVGRLQREGVVGYAETLDLVRDVLTKRWTNVHPQLDADDDNDPMLRANALLMLAEPVRVLRYLRYMPLARSARTGPVSWRDISITTGVVEVEDGVAKLTPAAISAAFRETDPAALADLKAALVSAAENVIAIPAAFEDAAGYGSGPDYTELGKLLRDIVRMIELNAVATDARFSADSVVDKEPEAGDPGSSWPAKSSIVNVASLGPVTSRADAVLLLDLVIEYYERNEPSSPLPLLIARARRLADKGFLDLIRDLIPDGLSQAERMSGLPEI